MNLRIFIPLFSTLILAGCSTIIPESGSFGWFSTSERTNKAAPEHLLPAPSPLLHGLSEREIASIKREALRVYGPIWEQIGRRSRYVRSPMLAALEHEHAPVALQMIPVVESGYNPYAVSEVGAAGLWQLMPETASDLRINSGKLFNGRRSIGESSRGAARFLLKQHDRFHSWPLALAAYHLGPNGVQRRIDRHPWQDGDGLRKLPLPPITKTYIRQILGLIALQQDRTLTFPEPYPTEQISVQIPVDLAALGRSSGLPKHQLFRFNPELEMAQYFEHQRQPLKLRVSARRIARLQKQLTNSKSTDLIITVAHGDSVKEISRRYHVSIYQLQQSNRRFSLKLRAGQQLRIPASAIRRIAAVKNPLVKMVPKKAAPKRLASNR